MAARLRRPARPRYRHGGLGLEHTGQRDARLRPARARKPAGLPRPEDRQSSGVFAGRGSRPLRSAMIGRRAFLAAASTLVLTGPAWAAPIPVTLYKTPECSCCEGDAAYLRQHGFAVTVKATDNLADISRKAGIPTELQGCHTAFIGDYVVDGHVPVEAIKKLLAEHPPIKGITLPGMPLMGGCSARDRKSTRL